MNTIVHTADDAGVAEAARLLRAGEVVAIPTETVYGLAANALDGQAVKKYSRPRAARRTTPSFRTSRRWRCSRTYGPR